jgi:hypothetical protein
MEMNENLLDNHHQIIITFFFFVEFFSLRVGALPDVSLHAAGE